ncbi:MAG: hypothetical protein HY731_04295 [Candidatus Tectomicrobia bacterium]|nr:hypothetical protein [Candidatus Tectomicrobia bacterium]
MWFLVVMILSAFVCYSIASAKHRATGNWFLSGLFLGPVAVLILLLLPDLATKEEIPGVSKKCPQCGEVVKSESRICRFCGYDFIWPDGWREEDHISEREWIEERRKRLLRGN